jgi:hypothetical protein
MKKANKGNDLRLTAGEECIPQLRANVKSGSGASMQNFFCSSGTFIF